MYLLDAVYATAWAIRPEALAAIIALAEREDVSAEMIAQAMHFDPARVNEAAEAVETRRGMPVDRTNAVTRRGNVAIVPIIGPIVRYAGLFSSVSGATSVETLATDLQSVLDDPAIEAVLLNVDSPGGEASGIAELADLIYAARDQKPIWAYVSDLGASAACWLATAASEVVLAPTAAMGSIGVVMAMRDPRAHKPTSIEFVSKVSPNKRPDPTTQAGKSQIQSLVDTLGTLFVEAIARQRGVDAETVSSDFGGGALLVGQDAVAAGLADRLGSFEGTLRDLAQASQARALSARLPPPARAPQPARVAPRRTAMTSLRDTFMALFDRAAASGALTDGSADQESIIMSLNLETATGGLPQITTSATSATLLPDPAASAGRAQVSDEQTRLLAELNALKADNSRLRRARINDAAASFAHAQLAELKAMPVEEPTIFALYAQALADDEQYGPVVLADGSSSTRATLVANSYAGRQSRKDIVAEIHDPGVLQVLAAKQSDRRTRADAEPSDERVLELLSLTALGQTELVDRRNGARR